jgi:hypothetical protein
LHTEVMNAATARAAVTAAPAATIPSVVSSQATPADGAVAPPGEALGAPAAEPVRPAAAPDSNPSAESEPQDSDEGISLDFTAVTVRNPFGEGEVQVDEIELPSLPGAPAAAVKDGDEYSRLASDLKEGTWLEFRSEKERHVVKLSYVSPFKSAYLFVNRQGQTVGEYALFELAAELRKGRAVVMEEVPLFDRAMSSLMGALRGGAAS